MARTRLRAAVTSLLEQPIHLGRGGRAIAEPPFAGMEWYDAYEKRHADDGADGRLVSLYRFEESWSSWEMHPSGDEVVLCLEGRMTLHQQLPDGTERAIELGPNEYAINPPCAWHTADCSGAVLALFITAGEGTQHRPR